MDIFKKILLFFIDKIADTVNTVIGSILGVVLVFYITKKSTDEKLAQLPSISLTSGTIFQILFSISFIFLTIIIVRNYKKSGKEYQSIESEHIVYVSKNQVRYERILKLLILKDGFRIYNTFHNWTGEKYTIKSLIDGQKVIKINSVDEHDDYQVIMPITYNKNDICDIHLQLICENKLHKAKPFWAIIVRNPTKLTKVKITFDNDFKINYVVKSYLRNYRDVKPKKQWQEFLDGKRTVKWDIEKPKIGEHYTISWEDSKIS